MTDDSVSRSARGVYGIAVTSELSGVGPQTLRLYERRGLLTPSRTDGGTRRYSDDDLERLRRITELVDQGVNLAGIAHILDLETRNSQLESDYTQLEVLNARLKADQRPTPGRNAAPKERRQDSGQGRRRAKLRDCTSLNATAGAKLAKPRPDEHAPLTIPSARRRSRSGTSRLAAARRPSVPVRLTSPRRVPWSWQQNYPNVNEPASSVHRFIPAPAWSRRS